MADTIVDGESALTILLSPDGYYTYLKVTSSEAQEDAVKFNEKVKKSYRRLSLRHHPDRPGGSHDVFQVLHRAHKVLSNPSLRKQYDMIGLDLDDEDVDADNENHTVGDDEVDKKNDDGSGKSQQSSNENEYPGAANSAISQIAAATIGAFMKLGVQTVFMAFVSVALSRYRILLYPSVLLLLYMTFSLYKTESGPTGLYAALRLLAVGAGTIIMHFSGHDEWRKLFWLGESVVLGLFMYNAIIPEHSAVSIAITVFAPIAAYFIGGSLWRYAALVGFEFLLGLILIIAFPMMEMILEELINEKLKKVGEKVRANAKRLNDLKGGKQS